MKTNIKGARKRLRKHIKSKGHRVDFDLTPAFCYYWWRQLNTTVFENQLNTPVRFEIRKFTKNAGWCQPFYPTKKYRSVIIGINSTVQDRKTFLSILAHEMVHQWEWEIVEVWSGKVHGVKFFDWKDKLMYRAGLPLTSTIDI